MYVFLSVLLTFCIVVIAALSIKLAAILTALKEINARLPEIVQGGTNNLICVSSADKNVKKLALTLNGQLTELRKKELVYTDGDREIKTALINAAHDLRTPLTVICGYLDLLESESSPQAAAEYIAVMREKAHALSELTEELFSYSVTFDDGKNRPPEKIEMGEALTECLAGFYSSFKKRGITPLIDVKSQPFYIIADKKDVDRLFSNVINNALKYSTGEFSVTAEGGKITFTNSAEGLDNIDAAKLFDRFYTVKNGRTSTGLGLSIAKTLCARMGGKIYANLSDGSLSVTLEF